MSRSTRGARSSARSFARRPLERRGAPMIRHFLDLFDITAEEAHHLLDLADRLKREDVQGHRPPVLAGRILGLIFEKPSLRTRVSFEAAMAHLGGNAIFLQGKDVGLGARETISD